MSTTSLSAIDKSPPRPTLRGSLKFRLAAIGSLLIALSVALTAGLALRSVDKHTEQVALDLSLAQTRKMARLVGSRLLSLQLALRGASERLNYHHPIDTAAATEFVTEHADLASLFDTLWIASADGRVLAFRDGVKVSNPTLAVGDRAYFIETLAQQRPMISPPLVGRAISEPVVILTMPLNNAEGRTVAVLAGGLRLGARALMPEITAADEDDPAHTVIVDSKGRVVSHPNRDWLTRDASNDPALADAIARWTELGRPIEPAGLAERLDDQLVTLAGIPDADWVVLRSAPIDMVLAGARDAQRHALFIGAAVALGGGLLLLGATYFLLRPLHRIERNTAEWMQGGARDAIDWPQPNNELGRLSRVLQETLQVQAASDADGRVLVDRLQAVMERAPVGIAFTRNRTLEAVSTHFEQLLGYAPGALNGQPTSLIYTSEESYQALRERYAVAFGAGQPYQDEIEILRRDGTRFWGRQQGQPVRWGDLPSGAIWILEDATVQRQERETLAWASSHDALTQLANRAEFERRMAAVCHDRRRREPASALFIDLDRFKAVNDTAGHAAGDAVLVAVARTLEAQVRQADLVARLGGDEFAVLLTRCDRDGAAGVAEKMRAAVDALRVPWSGESLSVGASIGVVEFDATLPDVAAILAAADAACYAAKHGGRNGVRVHGVAGLRLVN